VLVRHLWHTSGTFPSATSGTPLALSHLWHFPVRFVLHVLDEDGNISKEELPVYDLVIGEEKADACFNLLSQLGSVA